MDRSKPLSFCECAQQSSNVERGVPLASVISSQLIAFLLRMESGEADARGVVGISRDVNFPTAESTSHPFSAGHIGGQQDEVSSEDLVPNARTYTD